MNPGFLANSGSSFRSKSLYLHDLRVPRALNIFLFYNSSSRSCLSMPCSSILYAHPSAATISRYQSENLIVRYYTSTLCRNAGGPNLMLAGRHPTHCKPHRACLRDQQRYIPIRENVFRRLYADQYTHE